MKLNKLYYQITNHTSEGKSNLLFLHGLTGNTKRWTGDAPISSRFGSIIKIDLLGHGFSDSSDRLEDYSIRSQTKSVMDILIKENKRDIILISHSYSFPIALELINQDPKRFLKLILISPYIASYDPRIRRLSPILMMIKHTWNAIRFKRKSKPYSMSQRVSFLDIKRGIDDIGIKTYLAYLFNSYIYDSAGISRIKVPSLLIIREKDNLCNEMTIEFLKKNIIKMEISRIDGKGHLYLIRDKNQIYKIINNFL